MHTLIADEREGRNHLPRLRTLFKAKDNPIRIASPYVTHGELLIGAQRREIRLLTTLSPMDVVSGATSIETLHCLVKTKIKCKYYPERPRLHAKVYIFGKRTALITSANLTNSAFSRNIEVGVEVAHADLDALIRWYDELWAVAHEITPAELAALQDETEDLRRAYAKLKRKVNEMRPRNERTEPRTVRAELRALFEEANQYFVCNTCRRGDERTPTGGYENEEEMHRLGCAAAWERFNYRTHISRAKRGDAILMYAKGVGIIAIGRAKAEAIPLEPGESSRVWNSQDREWQIPVEWIDWRNEERACEWKSPNCTFLDVSGDEYDNLRQRVKKRFISS